MNIIDKILKLQNTNEVQIFVSATTDYTAGYKVNEEITKVDIILIPYKSVLMGDIGVILYQNNYAFQSSSNDVATFRKIRQ